MVKKSYVKSLYYSREFPIFNRDFDIVLNNTKLFLLSIYFCIFAEELIIK